jgi:hypothetical protein
MHNVSNKELLRVALMLLPFLALGALATSQLSAYFQASQQLGMRVFAVRQWYGVSVLLSLYAGAALFASTIIRAALTTWVKRNWIGQ